MKISAIYFAAIVSAGRNPINHLTSVTDFAEEFVANFENVETLDLQNKRLPQYQKAAQRLTRTWNS